jgi:hypothetical protein
MFVSCECVLSGRGLCDGPIPRPEEYHRLWCVSECDQGKINNLGTYCEQVVRRGKDYETRQRCTSDRIRCGLAGQRRGVLYCGVQWRVSRVCINEHWRRWRREKCTESV